MEKRKEEVGELKNTESRELGLDDSILNEVSNTSGEEDDTSRSGDVEPKK